MKIETATIKVLPFKTAVQPLKQPFPGSQKESQIFTNGQLLPGRGPVLSSPSTKQLILIYSEPFQNAADNFFQKENCQ